MLLHRCPTSNSPKCFSRFSFQTHCTNCKSIASPRCTSAHQVTVPAVDIPHEPFSNNWISKISPVLPNAPSLVSKIDTPRSFVQNCFCDVIPFIKTWLTGYMTGNQSVLSCCNSFLAHQTNRRDGGCLAHVESEFFVYLLLLSVLDILPDKL